ncbi:phosphocholine-specific phospholipase C [Deminuibacter soli]|uniref:phospholipase C n=1 Tax=Deminuibacter soli TaxID=2291815 RepID=A0A3E1NK72_9BACT|nr:phospholipase C, phosphocholine-specific [Deminuibacter soli]RFM28178.1 phospholipase C, phosphocholine-specific [Deminuibacter soli]
MESRRDFIKKAALLSGGAGMAGMLPQSIQKALAINPAQGSTYHDAEHVVLLMQENRSFDHCFGTLRGVRGFNDPRAIVQPNQLPVWLQSNKEGETYAPFRLNIKDSKATWMNSLPHSWENQVDAYNNGKHNRWLDVKKSGNKAYAHMPLTLGYYTREDIPFYYALADAFTVCDQHFCSSLTGTTPNRLYFWTGTIRSAQEDGFRAHVRNEEVDYGVPVHWKTYPERLEENGISWKVYQNEISIDTGFQGEEDAWLSSFTDNPLEWFSQYHIGFAAQYRKHLAASEAALTDEISTLEKDAAAQNNKTLQDKKAKLKEVQAQMQRWHATAYDQLSQLEQNLHSKAFTNNSADPHYRELTTLQYQDGDTARNMQAPKGDVLHQFRQDVQNGQLPAVSWLVAPENFSDHPGAPWYGAWYVSEVLDILTQNPEVWKKTIFILTYDENDGCFDHIPPFTAPHPQDKETGTVADGIDTASEFVTMQQELKHHPRQHCRESPIGLGYRVPMIIASPWSRGGWVNSQVFDHTSCLQFLEDFTARKGKQVKETNISSWRRAVCGDLTSAFRPYNGENITLPSFLEKDTVLENIHKAQFKQVPTGYQLLSAGDIAGGKAAMPKQEPGTRPSCALPYELYANGGTAHASFHVKMEAGTQLFGNRSAGAAFAVYAPGKHRKAGSSNEWETARNWHFAATPGSSVTGTWNMADFENGHYHLRVYGPNGFYREFKGSEKDPAVAIACIYTTAKNKSSLTLQLTNHQQQPVTLHLKHHAYGLAGQNITLAAAGQRTSTILLPLDVSNSANWYDFSITASDNTTYEQRFAGRAETGEATTSDPAMA